MVEYPEDFEAEAVAVANGERRPIDRLAALAPGTSGVVDMDVAPHDTYAWVVGRNRLGRWFSGIVRLDRQPTGRWTGDDSSCVTWDGWSDLAEPRPGGGWADWGPVLGLSSESGAGFGRAAYLVVTGIAAAGTVAVELTCRQTQRRRAVTSPTGGFVISLPVESAIDRYLHTISADGSRTRVVI